MLEREEETWKENIVTADISFVYRTLHVVTWLPLVHCLPVETATQ